MKGGAGNATEPTAGGRDAADAKATEATTGGRDAKNGVDLGKSMLDDILQLKKKQKEVRDAKLAVGKELRNAERRRKRLKQRARQLSDSDLLAVMSLRNHEKALGGQRDAAQEEEDHEDAELNPDNSGAGPSSGATPNASTKSRSKKQRRS